VRGVTTSNGYKNDGDGIWSRLVDEWNVTTLRLCYQPDDAGYTDMNIYFSGLASWIAEIRAGANNAAPRGGRLVLCIGGAPGGQGSEQEHIMLTDSGLQDEFMRAWEAIADGFKDSAGVWGYDLLNEPIPASSGNGVQSWHDLATRTGLAIRARGAKLATVVEPAVWHPANGTWTINGMGTQTLGQPGDIPVPGTYHGGGRAEPAVFRPSEGLWQVAGGDILRWGRQGDNPVPGDYNGDGSTDVAVWRPSEGTWYIRAMQSILGGSASDIPVGE